MAWELVTPLADAAPAEGQLGFEVHLCGVDLSREEEVRFVTTRRGSGESLSLSYFIYLLDALGRLSWLGERNWSFGCQWRGLVAVGSGCRLKWSSCGSVPGLL